MNKNDHHVEMVTITIRVPYDSSALILALESVDRLGEKMVGQAAFEFGKPNQPISASNWPKSWKTSVDDLQKTFSIIMSIITARLTERCGEVESEDYMNEQL